MKRKIMVTVLKTFNILGIVSAGGSSILSIMNGKFNEWTLIALLLFASTFFQTLHIERLEKRLKNNL